VIDRLGRDEQGAGDLGVGLSFADQLEHLAFTRSEPQWVRPGRPARAGGTDRAPRWRRFWRARPAVALAPSSLRRRTASRSSSSSGESSSASAASRRQPSSSQARAAAACSPDSWSRPAGAGQVALEPLDQYRLSCARLTGDQDEPPFTLTRFMRVLAQRGQHRTAFQQQHIQDLLSPRPDAHTVPAGTATAGFSSGSCRSGQQERKNEEFTAASEPSP
jgi:hypothetical protein